MSAVSRLQKMYRRTELLELIGLKRTQLAAAVKSGAFPSPLKLTPGGRAVAWLESDVVEWQSSRLAERDEKKAE